MFAGPSFPLEIRAGARRVDRILLSVEVDFVPIGAEHERLKLVFVPIDDADGPDPVVGVPAALNRPGDITE